MVAPISSESSLPLGLTFFEALTLLGVLLTIIATVAGSIIAVLISLQVERRRRERESQMQVFRSLLTLRQFAGDPAWTFAFNAVPVDFNGERSIVDAWRALLANYNHRPTSENEAHHLSERRRLTTAMLFKMAQLLKVSITEGEIGAEAYLAEGFANRDQLYMSSLAATCAIAEASLRSANAAEAMLDNLRPSEDS